ncbi:MAG: DUF881 domain-containing protein [Candidatus Eremiobacteraeota bacterium]|nr:DUF881 domain-containing protein [Candidatus Eremiobacteraeota bacterium]
MEKESQSAREKKIRSREQWEIPVAFACVVLGIMMALLFRLQKKEGFPLYNQRTDLIKMVNELERQRNKLESDLTDKKKRLEEFESAAGKEEDVLKAMKNQLETARMEAGFLPVKGPGIVVELNDSPKSPSPKDDPFYFIIHDVDLDTLVNELWASGAEAVSINDQRIVTTTAIRCVGPTVLINSVRIAAPYKVAAIGPSKDMEGALRTPGGFMDYMAPAMQHGVTLRINRYETVDVPEFKGSLMLRYAKVKSEVE